MQLEIEVNGERNSPIAGQDKALVKGAKIRVARNSLTTVYRNIWEVNVDSWAELYALTGAWPALTVAPSRYDGTDAVVILFEN